MADTSPADRLLHPDASARLQAALAAGTDPSTVPAVTTRFSLVPGGCASASSMLDAPSRSS